MKVDQFRVEVIEVDVGWESIKLYFDNTTIEFEASEIGREPLATFIESIVALQEVGKSIFEWNDELNILKFECHLQDEYMLYVSITLENECLESYISRWDFEMEYSMFKQVVVDVVFSTIERYGLEGFNDEWGNCDDELSYDTLIQIAQN